MREGSDFNAGNDSNAGRGSSAAPAAVASAGLMSDFENASILEKQEIIRRATTFHDSSQPTETKTQLEGKPLPPLSKAQLTGLLDSHSTISIGSLIELMYGDSNEKATNLDWQYWYQPRSSVTEAFKQLTPQQQVKMIDTLMQSETNLSHNGRGTLIALSILHDPRLGLSALRNFFYHYDKMYRSSRTFVEELSWLTNNSTGRISALLEKHPALASTLFSPLLGSSDESMRVHVRQLFWSVRGEEQRRTIVSMMENGAQVPDLGADLKGQPEHSKGVFSFPRDDELTIIKVAALQSGSLEMLYPQFQLGQGYESLLSLSLLADDNNALPFQMLFQQLVQHRYSYFTSDREIQKFSAVLQGSGFSDAKKVRLRDRYKTALIFATQQRDGHTVDVLFEKIKAILNREELRDPTASHSNDFLSCFLTLYQHSVFGVKVVPGDFRQDACRVFDLMFRCALPSEEDLQHAAANQSQVTLGFLQSIVSVGTSSDSSQVPSAINASASQSDTDFVQEFIYERFAAVPLGSTQDDRSHELMILSDMLRGIVDALYTHCDQYLEAMLTKLTSSSERVSPHLVMALMLALNESAMGKIGGYTVDRYMKMYRVWQLANQTLAARNESLQTLGAPPCASVEKYMWGMAVSHLEKVRTTAQSSDAQATNTHRQAALRLLKDYFDHGVLENIYRFDGVLKGDSRNYYFLQELSKVMSELWGERTERTPWDTQGIDQQPGTQSSEQQTVASVLAVLFSEKTNRVSHLALEDGQIPQQFSSLCERINPGSPGVAIQRLCKTMMTVGKLGDLKNSQELGLIKAHMVALMLYKKYQDAEQLQPCWGRSADEDAKTKTIFIKIMQDAGIMTGSQGADSLFQLDGALRKAFIDLGIADAGDRIAGLLGMKVSQETASWGEWFASLFQRPPKTAQGENDDAAAEPLVSVVSPKPDEYGTGGSTLTNQR